MKSVHYKVKICIVGCGAIGSRMAKSIVKDFSKDCRLTGLYDIVPNKAKRLEKKLGLKNIADRPLEKLIRQCDCMIEAVNAQSTYELIHQALSAKKSVLAMSVGKLLNAPQLFTLARKNKCYILLPSGAIAGLDAIKAASLARIDKITLTSRKPLVSFRNNPYALKRGIDSTKIKKETVIFSGNVDEAVKNFPQNINVAATIALACHVKKNFHIKIIASPTYKQNIHEIELIGDFGRITTKTENIVCPDNPKTSYLAALSGLQTLKQFCTGILIGT